MTVAPTHPHHGSPSRHPGTQLLLNTCLLTEELS